MEEGSNRKNIKTKMRNEIMGCGNTLEINTLQIKKYLNSNLYN